MGLVLVVVMEGKVKLIVGLLNVGEEDMKGNELVKVIVVLLWVDYEKGIFNFYGNVEGNDIFEGMIDLVVCDGFVGNVILKVLEGLGCFVKQVFISEFKKGIINKFGVLIVYGVIKVLLCCFNFFCYNGVSLLGLKGLVFKSYGGVDVYVFEWVICCVYDVVKYDVFVCIVVSMVELMFQEQGCMVEVVVKVFELVLVLLD